MHAVRLYDPLNHFYDPKHDMHYIKGNSVTFPNTLYE